MNSGVVIKKIEYLTSPYIEDGQDSLAIERKHILKNSKNFASKAKKEAVRLAMYHGATDEDIAESLCISLNRLKDWKLNDRDFKARLADARAEFRCDKIEDSLYQKAVGYAYQKDYSKLKEKTDDNGNVLESKLKVVKRVVEHVPPDVSAIKEYLHQRSPERWPIKGSGDYGDGKPTITVQIVNYASDTDPSAVQILPAPLSTPLLESDSERGEEGCIDLAPKDWQGQDLP